jgi:toxin ParE1/3/4
MLGYIAERNRPAGDRLEAMVSAGIATILQVPLAGRPGRVAKTREWIIHPNYIMIYRVTHTSITILRVLHARQRYP